MTDNCPKTRLPSGTSVIPFDTMASVPRPVRELKGFTKIELEPGEERAAVFDINEDMLRFTGADDVYRAEEGMFTVYIGNDSTTENEAKFELV